MSFVEDVFSEARLINQKPPQPQESIPIQKTLIYLMKRYPGRIRVRWVNPWTLHGLFFALVNRQRKFPAVFIKSKSRDLVLKGKELGELSERIAEFLSQSVSD
jgi:hypothetical protein